MAFNYQKLLGRITEKMGSQAEFARRMMTMFGVRD